MRRQKALWESDFQTHFEFIKNKLDYKGNCTHLERWRCIENRWGGRGVCVWVCVGVCVCVHAHRDDVGTELLQVTPQQLDVFGVRGSGVHHKQRVTDLQVGSKPEQQTFNKT